MGIPLTEREDRGWKRGPKTGWNAVECFTDKSNALMFKMLQKTHSMLPLCVLVIVHRGGESTEIWARPTYISIKEVICLCTQPLMTLLGAHEFFTQFQTSFGEFLSKVRQIGRASPAWAPLAVTWPTVRYILDEVYSIQTMRNSVWTLGPKRCPVVPFLMPSLKEPSKGNGYFSLVSHYDSPVCWHLNSLSLYAMDVFIFMNGKKG